MLQTHLVYSLPRSKNQPFLQGALFLSLEDGVRNRDLGAGDLTGPRASLLLDPLSGRS